jgi:hypothetical protein
MLLQLLLLLCLREIIQRDYSLMSFEGSLYIHVILSPLFRSLLRASERRGIMLEWRT